VGSPSEQVCTATASLMSTPVLAAQRWPKGQATTCPREHTAYAGQSDSPVPRNGVAPTAVLPGETETGLLFAASGQNLATSQRHHDGSETRNGK